MTRGRKNLSVMADKNRKENSKDESSRSQHTLRGNAKRLPVRPTLSAEDDKNTIKIKPLELAAGNKGSPSTTAKAGKPLGKSVPGTVRKKVVETAREKKCAAPSPSPSRSVREPTQKSTARATVSQFKHASSSPTMKKTDVAKLGDGEHTFVPKAITRRDVGEVRALTFDGSTPTRLFDPTRAKKRPFMRQKLPSAQEFEIAEEYDDYIKRMKITRAQTDPLGVVFRLSSEVVKDTLSPELSEMSSKMHAIETIAPPCKVPCPTPPAVFGTLPVHQDLSRRDRSKTVEELMDEMTPELRQLFKRPSSPVCFPSPINKAEYTFQGDDCPSDWIYNDKQLESFSPVRLPISPSKIPLPPSPEKERLPDIGHGKYSPLDYDSSQIFEATTPASIKVNLSRSSSVAPKRLLKEGSDSPFHADRESGCESKIKVGELLARRERGRRRGRTESPDVPKPVKVDTAILACGRRRAQTTSASTQQVRLDPSIMSFGRVVSKGPTDVRKNTSNGLNRRDAMKGASVDSKGGYIHLTSDGSDGEQVGNGLAANLKDFTKTIIKMKKGDRAVIEQFLEALRNVESDTDEYVWKAAANKRCKTTSSEDNPLRDLNPKAPAFRNLSALKDEARLKRFRSEGLHPALLEKSLEEIQNEQNVPSWTGFQNGGNHFTHGYVPYIQKQEPIWMRTPDFLPPQFDLSENIKHNDRDQICNYARLVQVKQENIKKGAEKLFWDEKLVPFMPIRPVPPPQPFIPIKPDPKEHARLNKFQDKLLASSVILRQIDDRMGPGREAKTLDQAWADQLLLNFRAKYPLTGTQAPSSAPKEEENESDDNLEVESVEATPQTLVKSQDNDAPVRKSWWEKRREATLVQQKLELLLQLKKDKAAMEEMVKNPSKPAKPVTNYGSSMY